MAVTHTVSGPQECRQYSNYRQGNPGMESMRWDFPHWPRGLPSLPYRGYWVSTPRV